MQHISELDKGFNRFKTTAEGAFNRQRSSDSGKGFGQFVAEDFLRHVARDTTDPVDDVTNGILLLMREFKGANI